MRMNIPTRDSETRGDSPPKYDMNGPQFMGRRPTPMPGNAFAQDLMRKGSFFEQRPSSYV
jgi:hypothetical protein